MRRHRGLLCALAVVGAAAFQIATSIACAQAGQLLPLPGAAQVEAELVADAFSIQPGGTFRLGVRLKMANGWHVNWMNPGDAGLAPSVAWKLPDGFKAGILQWPHPSRFITGPLVIFGYANEVLLMTDVRVPADLKTGAPVNLAAEVSWLACAEECIPGSATVRLQLPAEEKARPDSDQVKRFDETESLVPKHAVQWNVDARIDESTILVLDIQSGNPTNRPLEGLFFFPYDPGMIENAAPQATLIATGPTGQSVYELRVTRARIPAGAMTKVYGVLVASSGLSTSEGPGAIEVSVPVTRR